MKFPRICLRASFMEQRVGHLFYSFIFHYLAPCFILYLYFITDLLLFWVVLTSVWMVHSKPLTIPLTDTAPISHSSLS